MNSPSAESRKTHLVRLALFLICGTWAKCNSGQSLRASSPRIPLFTPHARASYPTAINLQIQWNKKLESFQKNSISVADSILWEETNIANVYMTVRHQKVSSVFKNMNKILYTIDKLNWYEWHDTSEVFFNGVYSNVEKIRLFLIKYSFVRLNIY